MRTDLCFYGLYVLVMLACAFPVFASPKEDLTQTTQELEQARARQKQIIKEQLTLERELVSLQEQLVEAAQVVRTKETELTQAQDKLQILREQLQRTQETLDSRRHTLESLVRAAIRLSQTPPEAMVMLPGSSAQTIKAASAMKMTASGVREEITTVQIQLQELKKLERKVADRHTEVLSKQTTLDDKRAILQRRLEERKALQSKLIAEEKEQAKKTAELAKKAEDLQSLMEELAKAQRESRKKQAEERKRKQRSFAKAKGDIILPVNGKIIQGFESSKARPDTAKGIVIAAKKNASVIAPFDGEVVFAGPFRSYGKMVILRHGSDYHTLIAGLGGIEVEVGEFLLEGEPIGAMGEEGNDRGLYMELRHDSQPVDPKPWLKN